MPKNPISHENLLGCTINHSNTRTVICKSDPIRTGQPVLAMDLPGDLCANMWVSGPKGQETLYGNVTVKTLWTAGNPTSMWSFRCLVHGRDSVTRNQLLQFLLRISAWYAGDGTKYANNGIKGPLANMTVDTGISYVPWSKRLGNVLDGCLARDMDKTMGERVLHLWVKGTGRKKEKDVPFGEIKDKVLEGATLWLHKAPLPARKPMKPNTPFLMLPHELLGIHMRTPSYLIGIPPVNPKKEGQTYRYAIRDLEGKTHGYGRTATDGGHVKREPRKPKAIDLKLVQMEHDWVAFREQSQKTGNENPPCLMVPSGGIDAGVSGMGPMMMEWRRLFGQNIMWFENRNQMLY